MKITNRQIYSFQNGSLKTAGKSAQQTTAVSSMSITDWQERKKKLKEIGQEKERWQEQKLAESCISKNSVSYADSLKTQRQNAKNTALKLKKLKYQFKNFSSKIISSKTSVSARKVASQVKREIMRLKREKKNESSDSKEIDAAIAHAQAMERVAKKKARHLEEEEMLENRGNFCAYEEVEKAQEQTEDKLPHDSENGNTEETAAKEMAEEIPAEEMQEGSLQKRLFAYENDMESFLPDMEELTQEMLDNLEEGMQDLLAELGLDEENGYAVPVSPEDLKALKIKHRNKEMKDIVKADADYLKTMFHHYEQLRTAAVQANASPVQTKVSMTPPVAAAVSVDAVQPVIDVVL